MLNSDRVVGKGAGTEGISSGGKKSEVGVSFECSSLEADGDAFEMPMNTGPIRVLGIQNRNRMRDMFLDDYLRPGGRRVVRMMDDARGMSCCRGPGSDAQKRFSQQPNDIALCNRVRSGR